MWYLLGIGAVQRTLRKNKKSAPCRRPQKSMVNRLPATVLLRPVQPTLAPPPTGEFVFRLLPTPLGFPPHSPPGSVYPPLRSFDIDHVHELRDGGADTLENCQALCANCHARKTKVQARSASPKRVTRQPSVVHVLDLRARKPIPRPAHHAERGGFVYREHKPGVRVPRRRWRRPPAQPNPHANHRQPRQKYPTQILTNTLHHALGHGRQGCRDVHRRQPPGCRRAQNTLRLVAAVEPAERAPRGRAAVR